MAILAVGTCCLVSWAQQVSTDHFRIYHEAGFAVSASYSRLVAESLEAAYSFFQSHGFPLFPGSVRVDILETGPGELGAEYLEEGDGSHLVPRLEIATESVMLEYLTYAYVPTTLEDLVRSTCAHEVFHAVQEHAAQQGVGDISEAAFVEAHATAVQEFVVASANDYLDPALDFLLAPDSIAFFQRTYDAGIFWIYAIDRLGMDFLPRVMASSAAYDGRHAIDHALTEYGLSFLDLWADFAISLATGRLRDEETIAALIPLAEGSGWWVRNRPAAPLPPVVFRQPWTGEPITASRVSTAVEAESMPKLRDDPVGSDLRVAHAYGIDILEIPIESLSPLLIEWTGDPQTEFRIAVALETQEGWSSMPLSSTTVSVQPSSGLSRIRIIVTRSEPGTGVYAVSIDPTSVP